MRVRLSSVWHQLDSGRRRRVLLAGAAMVLAALIGVRHFAANADEAQRPKIPVPANRADADALELSDAQLEMIHVGAVSESAFPLEREAVGSIDFNEDLAAQVFPPYQGRIVQLHAKEIGRASCRERVCR